MGHQNPNFATAMVGSEFGDGRAGEERQEQQLQRVKGLRATENSKEKFSESVDDSMLPWRLESRSRCGADNQLFHAVSPWLGP